MIRENSARSREVTEKKIIQAVHELVEENGFESLGVNVVATRAGVSKMLIYRYFESLNGLIAAYIKQNDFWINFTPEVPDKESLNDFVKKLFYQQIVSLRENNTLRRLSRWELTTDNEFIVKLQKQREKKGLELINIVSSVSGIEKSDIAQVATLISAAISYIALLGENCEMYNGIPIQKDSGWNQLENSINRLVDKWF